MKTAAVVVRGAEVRFGDRVLWSGVDVDIEAGSFAAILGPNGIGKSTLLKVLLDLLPLSAGTATVLGAPVGERRDRTGYVPQRSTFDRSMRIRGVDVVRLGLDGARWGIPLPNRRSRDARLAVRHAIDHVGASAYADRPIGLLSGGEQQRLVIAQAMVRQPDLLLLDEPLDSLDLANQASVAAVLRRVCRDHGVTVIMVAHDVNPILDSLDQVVYLARGRAVSGSPDEVITSETLTALYGAPIEVLRTSDGRLVVVGAPEPLAIHADRHAQ